MSALDDLLRKRYGVAAVQRPDLLEQRVDERAALPTKPKMMMTRYVSGGASVEPQRPKQAAGKTPSAPSREETVVERVRGPQPAMRAADAECESLPNHPWEETPIGQDLGQLADEGRRAESPVSSALTQDRVDVEPLDQAWSWTASVVDVMAKHMPTLMPESDRDDEPVLSGFATDEQGEPPAREDAGLPEEADEAELDDVSELARAAEEAALLEAIKELDCSLSEPPDDKIEAHDQEPPAVQRDPFRPEWEIDAFPWPTICDEIQVQVADELRAMLETALHTCREHNSNQLIFTSAHDGVGRTTLSLCVAREAARQGKTVAIVELDHQQPAILKRLGIEFEQGIESLTEPKVTAETIGVSAVQEGVCLFPAVGHFELRLCGSTELTTLLRTASQHYDLVVIDASREVADLLVEGDEARALGVIMVDDGKSRNATLAFVDWLHEKQAWTLGVIENFAA